MRCALAMAILLITSSCGGSSEPVPSAGQNKTRVPANSGQVPPRSAAPEKAAPTKTVPLDPPEDPALAGLSPARRSEYERGYRDCALGQYAFDADQQGEYYRIGCMTAENAKADGER